MTDEIHSRGLLNATSMSTSGGTGSVAIAARPEDIPEFQSRSMPDIQMANATPFSITSVEVEVNGTQMQLIGEIPPMVKATPDINMLGLYCADQYVNVSSVIAYPVSVSFEGHKGFTLGLNLSTATDGSNHLIFYIYRRGIFVANELGDPRAMAWVS